MRLHVPTVPAEGGEGRRGLLRTWLSSLLCPDGAGFFLLPPAHLSPLTLWPVWGKCWLFPGFGSMATTFGDAEMDQASGRCVNGVGRVGMAEKHTEIEGGLWIQWLRREATQVGLGGCIGMVWVY